MIEPERVQLLNRQHRQPGRYVLYWMQASQRAEENPALEFAVHQANKLRLPVVAFFGITDRFPEANERHYTFMLEGLRETQATLRERGIQLVVWHESPEQAVPKLSAEASVLVTDRGYTRLQKRWRSQVARVVQCQVVQVEGDVVVPVEVASPKEEYAARTIRPKLLAHREQFLTRFRETPVRHDSLGIGLGGMALADVEAVIRQLRINRTARTARHFLGGTSQAKRLLADFIDHKLEHYSELHNDPAQDYASKMSPYLHFGHISPLYIAREVARAGGSNTETYLEELVIRRELSINFVHYNADYDSCACLPGWARATLEAHRRDKRPMLYSESQLELAQTSDPYWNAAQSEMVATGMMHGYMRMYWGKRLLEWTAGPEEAFRIALRLNNRYELDGRDPNGFTGVAWCLGKHDRPWKERPIFGTVRYMNAAGLERKFNMSVYVRKVELLVAATVGNAPGGQHPQTKQSQSGYHRES
jgi:deoxyribodipyrimidine photo-lyase